MIEAPSIDIPDPTGAATIDMSDVRIIEGDCLDVLKTLRADSVDTVITDPPYALNFMGKSWDTGAVAFDPETWRQVLRVTKPGAFLLAFGGTRTFHRLACTIEDAGWQLRDCIMWLYGSGFPKSLDISKAIDKEAGAERQIVGVKAGHENFVGRATHPLNGGWDRPWAHDAAAVAKYHQATKAATDAAKLFNGYGTALKPAWEPILVAMKPCEGTFAHNAIEWGVAGLNIDGGRIGTNGRPLIINRGEPGVNIAFGSKGGSNQFGQTSLGRWPANLILDEESARLLDEQSGTLKSGMMKAGQQRNASKGKGGYRDNMPDEASANGTFGDSGGASRFFYTAKASRSERGDGNTHPTVKPRKLLEYLAKLTRTPTGGTVLDPFMGSGTTGLACLKTGRRFIGIEKDKGYFKIARKRIESAQNEATVKAQGLFAA